MFFVLSRLVHHAQNCRGDLDDLSTDGHYAGDGKGREIDGSYLLGNGFLVRVGKME